MEVAQQLSLWGENCDDDVSDVTDKIGVLIYEIGELEDQYVDRYDQYRVTIKSIRNIEASGTFTLIYQLTILITTNSPTLS
jgi:hypothetical protein